MASFSEVVNTAVMLLEMVRDLPAVLKKLLGLCGEGHLLLPSKVIRRFRELRRRCRKLLWPKSRQPPLEANRTASKTRRLRSRPALHTGSNANVRRMSILRLLRRGCSCNFQLLSCTWGKQATADNENDMGPTTCTNMLKGTTSSSVTSRLSSQGGQLCQRRVQLGVSRRVQVRGVEVDCFVRANLVDVHGVYHGHGHHSAYLAVGLCGCNGTLLITTATLRLAGILCFTLSSIVVTSTAAAAFGIHVVGCSCVWESFTPPTGKEFDPARRVRDEGSDGQA
ncbi:unnamed protein product [Prorocentrum cordatum]|uniref:Uncharacterized protein n=1 Tax=Prorocentrum cordatum TaxID=2364126 RepID=A0ABN9THC3_9DINO|nr:unnamed protein product [Polarella glacialis]